jgi:ABC-type nitrate/sulfonate/bicarbonate transport system permease component
VLQVAISAAVVGRTRPIVLGVAGVIAFLAVWELATRLGWVNARYVPAASETLTSFGGFLLDRHFWRMVGDTMLTWLIGMSVATGLAIVLGTTIGLSSFLRNYTRTTIEFLRPIPSVAIIPIAVVLLGPDRDSSLVIVIFATFWQVLIQVLYGVADVDPVARDTQRSFGIGPFRRFVHLVLPTTLPYLMTGIRLGATVAMILTVTGELLIGSVGIGRLMMERSTVGDYAGTYAVVLTAGLLALAINLLVRGIERRVLSWHQSVRGEVLA